MCVTTGPRPGSIRWRFLTAVRIARVIDQSNISPALQPFCMSTATAAMLRLALRGQVRLTFCLVYLRRRFYELAAQGNSPVATRALQLIGALHRLDTDIRGADPDELRAARA